MKKKALIVLLVLIIAMTTLFALVACNNDDDKNTIVFYHTMSSKLSDVLDEFIDEFNTLYNPNYTIKWEQVGDYNAVRDQIKIELNAKKHPSMAYCYPDHVAIYNAFGATATLDEYINSTEEITLSDGTTTTVGLTEAQKNDFIQGYYDEGKQFGDGLMYSMPFAKSSEVLYYNKDFFETNKKYIEVPTHWWCREELGCTSECKSSMEKVCEWIKSQDNNCTPLGYDSEDNWFITMCEQMGSGYTSNEEGNHFLFDNATNKEFTKRIRTWYQNRWVTTKSINGGYTSKLFVKQKSYMSIGSTAGATNQRPTQENNKYPFEVGIASIPQYNPAQPKVIAQGPSVCMFKDSDKEREKTTWLFIKFLTTNVRFQAKFSDVSGYVPVLKSVTSDPVFESYMNQARDPETNNNDYIAYLSVDVCLKNQDAYFTSPAFIGSSEARTQVGNLLAACMTEANPNFDQLFAGAVAECKYQIGE